MPFCVKCGAEITESARYCAYCGTAAVGARDREEAAGLAAPPAAAEHPPGPSPFDAVPARLDKPPISPRAILWCGILLSPMVSGIMASLNFPRYGIRGMTGWGIWASVSSALMLGLGLDYFDSPAYLSVWVSLLLAALIYIHQKNWHYSLRTDPHFVPAFGAGRQIVKLVAIGATALFLVFAALVIAADSADASALTL